MHTTTRALALFVICSTASACHLDYRLLPLTCAFGIQGELYDVEFDVAQASVKADVHCVADPDDAYVEARITGTDRTAIYKLEDCTVVTNPEDRDRYDLLGCELVSWFRGPGQCMPPLPGTDLKLMVSDPSYEGEALDKMFVPVHFDIGY